MHYILIFFKKNKIDLRLLVNFRQYEKVNINHPFFDKKNSYQLNRIREGFPI